MRITRYETDPIKQFLAKPNSRTLAIKAKCAECMGCTLNHLEKGFRESISNCSSLSCPLHGHRPYQHKESLKGQKTHVEHTPNMISTKKYAKQTKN